MSFTPTYGSVFVYGAAHAPDRVRLSGPATGSPAGDGRWYGDSPETDSNGTPFRGEDYGPTVDKWENATHPGYPVGPASAPTWVPNSSWLYGVALPDGRYTRVVQPRWLR